MPSKETYRAQVAKHIADNQEAKFWTIHNLLHQGRYEHAEGWADEMGLNLPPDQNPQFGFPLTPELRAFLRETFDSHKPTETGLPDHDY